MAAITAAETSDNSLMEIFMSGSGGNNRNSDEKPIHGAQEEPIYQAS